MTFKHKSGVAKADAPRCHHCGVLLWYSFGRGQDYGAIPQHIEYPNGEHECWNAKACAKRKDKGDAQ